MIKHIAVAIALSLAPALFAQTYIVAEGDCGAITLHATRGTDFPNLGETISADRVKDAHVDQQKERVIVTPAVAGARSLDFSANVPEREEVVMAAVELKPVVSGNETRTEHAKALIFCGAVTPRWDWQRSTGLGLEIYPQGWNGPRPKMKQGDKMRFIVVHEGTPQVLLDLPMELYRAGDGLIGHGMPDEHRGMDFPYPKPGRYMVTTTYRRPDPQQPDHWLVDTSTLTFEIK
jgi:hypothetical protein